MKKFLPVLSFLLLTACGGGNEPAPASSPVTMAPAEPVVAVPGTVMPEPVVVVPPDPVVMPEPTVEAHPEAPIPSSMSNPANRTTVTPVPPVGKFTIYRQELTNSPSPWYELVGSFDTLQEANARFTTGDGLMWQPEYQYLIMSGNTGEVWDYNWQRMCIEC